MTDNTNPGNFANRPKEEVQEIASKGGQASHTGGFASMPKEQVVCPSPSPSLPISPLSPYILSSLIPQHPVIPTQKWLLFFVYHPSPNQHAPVPNN